MRVTCPKCGFQGNVEDNLIAEGGLKVVCPKCKERFYLRKPIVSETKSTIEDIAPRKRPRDGQTGRGVDDNILGEPQRFKESIKRQRPVSTETRDLITPYHAKYFAYELTRRFSSDDIQKLAHSLSDARIDLNPHQIEAALFAFRSPLSKGAILADEVGLGKTIEAGIVISQKWAERKRKILIIVPANLRKQWSQELLDKFFLPTYILETKSFDEEIRQGNLNPFDRNEIVICSYQFARKRESDIRSVSWDLIVIDEAHHLKNVYKPTNKIANAIKNALVNCPKILLTATPLQNTLMELYGLVSIVDEHAFGDLRSYGNKFARLMTDDNFDDLKQRLEPICIRTLRRQVREYVKYTNRIAFVQEFYPTEEEQRLYDLVSDYLQRPNLYALPSGQRMLMTLVLRKLLASSTYAISGTLEAFAARLELASHHRQEENDDIGTHIGEDFEAFDEIAEEWLKGDRQEKDEREIVRPGPMEEIRSEIDDLKTFCNLAKSIKKNSKGEVLLTALKTGLAETEKRGGKRKAVIFTESVRTQRYLSELLEKTEYSGKIVLFNGSNNDRRSNEIYQEWLKRYKGTNRITASKTADKRAAIIDYFRDEAVLMLGTEAAAEGINLQFCSLVVNYDLPWNPQRVEQRIGRCHRYGQENDVVVVNFLNKRNAADQRVYELLAEKFRLFDGVFGASDEVLGSVESGVDFEKRIAEIYQKCRTDKEIQSSFDALQAELEPEITETIRATRQKLLENFDEEVHEKFKINDKWSGEFLTKYQDWLWKITRFRLMSFAEFYEEDHSFFLRKNPFGDDAITMGAYRLLGKNIGDAYIYRIGHPLAQRIIVECMSLSLESREVIFDYTGAGKKISVLRNLIGKSGWISVACFTVSTFETEDHIIMTGVSDNGKIIDAEQCQRLFSLPAREGEPLFCYDGDLLDALTTGRERQKKQITGKIEGKNRAHFEKEIDKLDRWAEDRNYSLKVALDEYDEKINELRKEARLSESLEKRVRLERDIARLEKKRDEAWRENDNKKIEIYRHKDLLLDDIERKLSTDAKEEGLFAIRWRVV